MPLRSFLFESTNPTEPEGRNWRTLDQASKTIVKTDLSIGSPTNSPTVGTSYFTLYGPIVFFVIQLSVPNNAGWTTSSYIYMPYDALYVATAPEAGGLYQVYRPNAGTVITTAYTANTADQIRFAAAYTNVSGLTESINIQGWYIRT